MQDSLHKAVVPVAAAEALVLLDDEDHELIKNEDGVWEQSPVERTVSSFEGKYHYFNKQAQEWHALGGGGTSLVWGKMAEELIGMTTTPKKVNRWKFTETGVPGGSGGSALGGSWSQMMDESSEPIVFYTVDVVIPTSKKLAVGKWVGCAPISANVYAIVVCECPVAV